MTIQIKQVPSHYFGHFYEHIEYGGIYQLVFKTHKAKKLTPPVWE